MSSEIFALSHLWTLCPASGHEKGYKNMWNNIILIICFMCPLLYGFVICRYASSYYSSLRWRRFVTIKNTLLHDLLVAGSRKSRKTGRLVSVAYTDCNKMTLLGLAAHLLLDSTGIVVFYFCIQERILLKECYLEMIGSFVCWTVFFLVFVILDHINGKDI